MCVYHGDQDGHHNRQERDTLKHPDNHPHMQCKHARARARTHTHTNTHTSTNTQTYELVKLGPLVINTFKRERERERERE